MNILVCISKTPDTTSKISFVDENTKFNTDGIQYIMNPYDEWYALVKAIEVKESLGGEVTVIHVGEASSDVIIRKALAIGADKAVRINADAPSAKFVAKQISDYAKKSNFDFIILGKETIDYNGSEIGSMIAGYMDLPFISYGISMNIGANGAAEIERSVEGGAETVSVQAPFVVSAAKGMAEQRIPNMRGIMMAKRKPLEVVEPTGSEENVVVSSYSLPEEKSGVKMVDPENMDELVRLLHEEAKVI